MIRLVVLTVMLFNSANASPAPKKERHFLIETGDDGSDIISDTQPILTEETVPDDTWDDRMGGQGTDVEWTGH